MSACRSAAIACDRPPRAFLLAEFAVLFVGVPCLYLSGLHVHPILLAGAVAAVVFVMLRRDRRFSTLVLWNRVRFFPTLKKMLFLFGVVAALVALTVAVASPARFLNLPLDSPKTWLTIMLIYTLISVYPQEVIYRAFFFHRYAPLFGDGRLMIVASAAMFSLVHIVFHNAVAVLATFLGGLLFAWRYRRTRSLLLVSVEHALYGNLMFTIGLGEFFLYGQQNRSWLLTL